MPKSTTKKGFSPRVFAQPRELRRIKLAGAGLPKLTYQHMIHLLEKRRSGHDINEGNKVNLKLLRRKRSSHEQRRTAVPATSPLPLD